MGEMRVRHNLTLSTKALRRQQLEPEQQFWRDIAAGSEEPRPRTRADCCDGPRPCPFVGCRYHLYLDVSPIGSLVLNFPALEPGDLAETCALDIAERGSATLEEIAKALNITRERARQLEARALERLQTSGGAR